MGADITYSGTVGAAFEAALRGLPAIAVSVESRSRAGCAEAEPLLRGHRAPSVIARGLPRHTILNVNLPDRPLGADRRRAPGSPRRRQSATTASSCASTATARACSEFLLARRPPVDRRTGQRPTSRLVAHGFVALTPMRYDLLDAAALRRACAAGTSASRRCVPSAPRASAGFDPVVFDLDGTVVDTVELIVESFRYATRTVLGVVLPDEVITGRRRPAADDPDAGALARACARALRRLPRVQPPPPRRAHPRVRGHRRAAGRPARRRAPSRHRHQQEPRHDADGVRGRRARTTSSRSSSPPATPTSTSRRRCRCCLCLERLGRAGRRRHLRRRQPRDIQAGAAAGMATAAVAWGVFGKEALLAVAARTSGWPRRRARWTSACAAGAAPEDGWGRT